MSAIVRVVGQAGVLYHEADVLVLTAELDSGRSVRYLRGHTGGESFGKLGYLSPLRGVGVARVGKQLGIICCVNNNVAGVVVPVCVGTAVELEEEFRYGLCKRYVQVVVTCTGRHGIRVVYRIEPCLRRSLGISHCRVPDGVEYRRGVAVNKVWQLACSFLVAVCAELRHVVDESYARAC